MAHRFKECIYPGREPALSRMKDLEKIIDVTHNSVAKLPLTINGQTQQLWVHRKGAAPADKGVVPCPGSRGDFSWLLQPTGDGQFNAHFLPHGAGRRHGRNVLRSDHKMSKSSLTTTALAYRDIGCAVHDMDAAEVCEGMVILRPVVTYKVRQRGEGRKCKRLGIEHADGGCIDDVR
ncbi:tRNA-splicing ligase [Lyophyllum atratum]|nr:tRNA-splicing ligase [Lyophyllum atratum]